MSSELEVLKQRISELEAKNDKLEAENAELRKENTEIRDLRFKLSVSDAEIAELKRRNAETLRSNAEYNERRDAENAKLKARIEEMESEFGDRITKVEQKQTLNEPRGASHNSSNNSSPSFNSIAVPEAITVPTNSAKRLNGKLLEEKDMDSFLLEAHKKIVSKVISKEMISGYDQNAIDEIEPQSSVFSNTINLESNVYEKEDVSDHALVPSAKSSEEKETDAFLNEVDKKMISDRIRQRNREKKLQRKNEQDLIREISTGACNNLSSSSDKRDHDSISQVTKISLTSGQRKSDILQNIANLYEKACDAEDVSIKANQAEILCWSNFIIAFDKSIDEIMARDRVGMKKAKGLIYDFILAQNPDTKRPALYKKIERARKIYRLTEKIGLDKVKYIKTYSAKLFQNLPTKKFKES
ncbi:hypothetical protein RhiirA4_487747 [Rhizophagus irregularis]|uniref:Uncharacterized protein n=1 Tax=Rhizophagus irregularis TaxID=588596 RepID=A0A2I1HSY2_9GLOM|nr:hypothetical protein RhiirA4_487747 [Rhizophagus irregularis]